MIDLDTAFFVAIWIWMHAHPTATCDEFLSAVEQAVRLVEAKKRVQKAAT